MKGVAGEQVIVREPTRRELQLLPPENGWTIIVERNDGGHVDLQILGTIGGALRCCSSPNRWPRVVVRENGQLFVRDWLPGFGPSAPLTLGQPPMHVLMAGQPRGKTAAAERWRSEHPGAVVVGGRA
jgi:hypothetical protein